MNWWQIIVILVVSWFEGSFLFVLGLWSIKLRRRAEIVDTRWCQAQAAMAMLGVSMDHADKVDRVVIRPGELHSWHLNNCRYTVTSKQTAIVFVETFTE